MTHTTPRGHFVHTVKGCPARGGARIIAVISIPIHSIEDRIGFRVLQLNIREHTTKANLLQVSCEMFLSAYQHQDRFSILQSKRFFYVNPLEVIPGITGEAVTHRYTLPQRPKWYTCACCPPNVARLISSFGKYAYTESCDTVFCHLYASGKITAENGTSFTCQTRYPYDFEVNFAIEKGGNMAIRIPGYTCGKYALFINNFPKDAPLKDGYIYFEAKDGDSIKIKFEDKINIIYPSAKIPNLSGSVALSRGPLVYCFEGVDNHGRVTNLKLDTNGDFKTMPYTDDILGETVVIEAKGTKIDDGDNLYSFAKPESENVILRAVPYYLWGNRGENEMRVWMTEK